MRFSLRNQEKIKEKLGENIFKDILNCLKKQFENNAEIIEIEENQKYKTIKTFEKYFFLCNFKTL